MSKMDDLRAMREARYAQRLARAGAAAKAAPSAVRRPPQAAVEADPTLEPGPAEAGPCGHRSISGRTCTRERGHAAKSHRYS